MPPEPAGPSPRFAPPRFPHQERALSRQASLGSDGGSGPDLHGSSSSTPKSGAGGGGGSRGGDATAFASTGATPPHLAGAPFMGNPLYESSPSDARGVSGVIGGGVRKEGGIGLSKKDTPESHLRKARAGGLLTKLPFGPTASAAARPKIRFFRVTADGTELQWGDPKDAAKPALDSRLPLADVHAVVTGHDTATFERFKKRAAPPAMCFSLVCASRTVDMFAGTPNEAAQWSGALEHLARIARESLNQSRQSSQGPAVDEPTRPAQTLSRQSSLQRTTSGGGSGLARTSSNASSGGSPMSPAATRSAPVRFTPAPRSEAEVALDFVPIASQPPQVDGHISLDLRDGIERDGGWGTQGVVYNAASGGVGVSNAAGSVDTRRDYSRSFEPGSALEPVAGTLAGVATVAAGSRRWRERSRGAVDPGHHEGTRGAGARGRAAGKSKSEDVVEAFSRARHGRVKELDALFQRKHVDPASRDQHGLTLLHMAAQNNQRKAAKLVLKRTDFSTDPPRLELINSQTNLGHTPLHFAFAYGYHELGKYLLSLGADDTVANMHGMTCYEGLDPDEPQRDCLNTGEMRGLARSAELRRRVESMRPGAGAGSSSAPGITHPLGRPSGIAGLGRDSGVPLTARGGASSGLSGGSTDRSDYSAPYAAAPYTPRDVGYGPSHGPLPPGHPYAAPPGHSHGYPPNPYATPTLNHTPNPYGNPGGYPVGPNPMTGGFPVGYNPMDPMGVAAQMAAQQQMAAAAAMSMQMQAMQMNSPVGSMGSTHSPMGSTGSMPAGFNPAAVQHRNQHGHTVSSQGSAVNPTSSRGSANVSSQEDRMVPPSPIMGGLTRAKGSERGNGGSEMEAEAAWERALDSRRARRQKDSKSDSSNLDSSDDDETLNPNPAQHGSAAVQNTTPGEAKRRERRRAGAEASARVAAAGGRRGDRAARDVELDREAALRAAALRKHGYHSSDSDSPTSASEAESSRRAVTAGGAGRRERAERSKAATTATGATGKSSKSNPVRSEPKPEALAPRPGDIDVAAREEAARAREEKRRQRAGAMRGATAAGEAGKSSCLPARTASKIAMVLGAHPGADPSSILDVLTTGSLADTGVTLEALRAIRTVVPTPADVATVRATHGMGAAADAKVAAAALADRFVHECSKTARIDAKLDALILRETFLERSESIETSLVRVKDASEQACGSDALGKLLDIVVALSAILEKDKPKTPSANASGRSAYKLASLAKLATTPAAATSKASSVLGGNTLLHHLSKTVESKSTETLRWAESLSSLSAAAAAPTPGAVRERIAELRRGVKDAAAEGDACERDGDGVMAAALRAFVVDAGTRLDVLWATSEAADESAARLLVAFGSAPKGTAPGDVLRTLSEFAGAFERATAENRRARIERGKELT